MNLMVGDPNLCARAGPRFLLEHSKCGRGTLNKLFLREWKSPSTTFRSFKYRTYFILGPYSHGSARVHVTLRAVNLGGTSSEQDGGHALYF